MPDVDYSTKTNNTSIPVQKSLFGPDKYLADSRQKLAQLYFKNPEIASSEKRVILEFWKAYDGLQEVLGNKTEVFTSWFLAEATSNETITRCLRALKEDGTIPITPEKAKQRQEREKEYRRYWGKQSEWNCAYER
ncbi:hypothetical protein ACFLYF_04565 [Chloroflexota bacterium]